MPTLSIEALEDRRLLSGGIREFTIRPDSDPLGITAGPDGNIWVTDYSDRAPSVNKIWKISTAGTVLGEFLVSETSRAYDIVAGPDGNLWFTEWQGRAIGRMNVDGVVTGRYPITGSNCLPTRITVGPDNRTLWFTGDCDYDRVGYVGRIDPFQPDGSLSIFTTSLWVARPHGITAGPDGNVWFTTYGNPSATNRIGRITPAGTISSMATLSENSQPSGIMAGWDGNLWFVEYLANTVRRITPEGILLPAIPANGSPYDITVGPRVHASKRR